MAQGLRSNKNLNSLELGDSQLKAMIDVAWSEKVQAGRVLIQQGALEADYFYVVHTGGFEVFVAQEGQGKSADMATAVASIRPGGSFGELSLLYFAPRAATVKASVDSEVWVIDRNNFKAIWTKSAEKMASTYIDYLRKVKILSALKDDEFIEVATGLVEMAFSQGETIFNQGEHGDKFFILLKGSVSVIKDS